MRAVYHFDLNAGYPKNNREKYMVWLKYLQLVIFRVGPEDMPAGWQATTWAFIWFLLTGSMMVFADRATGESLQAALGQGFFDNVLNAILVAGYAWGWLVMRKHPERLAQLLTALYAALGLLSLVLAALWWLMPITPGKAATNGWWIIALFVWDVLVVGQIFRRALDLSAALGALISLGYFILAGVGVVWAHTLVFG